MENSGQTLETGPRASDWRAERFVATMVLVASCAYLLLFRRYTDLDPDEGIILQGAARILRGQVLYRDFFSFFTPGSYYFLAGLFKIFGSSFLVARTALALMGAVMSLIHYLLARRVCSRRSALVATALVTLTCVPSRFLVLHNWDSTFGACLALYCAARWLDAIVECRLSNAGRAPSIENRKSKTGNGWAFATGTLSSLTFLFEQSKGAGLLLGLLAGFAVILWREKGLHHRAHREHGGASQERFSVFNFRISIFALGLAWPLLVTLIYFGAQHSLSPMLADWLWPLRHYSTANHVFYGYQNWSESTLHLLFFSGSWVQRFVTILTISPCLIIPVLPLASVGIFLACAFGRTALNAETRSDFRFSNLDFRFRRWSYYVLVNAALSGLLVSVLMVRADIVHFFYLAPLFYLVLAWLLDGRDVPGSLFKAGAGPARTLLMAYLLVAFGLLSMPLFLRSVRTPYRYETRRGAVTTQGKDTVLEFVQAHVPPGRQILVYPYLPLYYYLTDTFSPTRYEYFQPGMHTPQQAREMAAELAARPVDVVLLENSFVNKIPTSWPRTPVAALADDLVVDYVVQNYRACGTLRSPSDWRFVVMVRKDVACPGEEGSSKKGVVSRE